MPKAPTRKSSDAKSAKKKTSARARKAATGRASKSRVAPERTSWSKARDEQHRIKRDAILRVASRLINRKGDAGTSLADIARELDLRDASLYYYFESKSDLVFACFQRAQRIDLESLDIAEEIATSGLDAIERYVGVMGSRVREEGELPLPIGIRALEPEQMKTIDAGRLDKLKRIVGLIERGIADKSIRPCDVPLTASMLMGALLFLPGHFATVAPTDWPRLNNELIVSLRRFLGA